MSEGDNTAKEERLKGFWIGPRLGRRKRNPKLDETFRSPVSERDNLADVFDAVDDAPWAIVAVKGNL